MQNAYTTPEDGRPLDLNTTSADALRERCSIALALARRIVEDRELNGPFVDPRDVARVPGVGARTLQRIVDNVTVEPPTVRPGSLLPFRPVDPARLAPTVPPGGLRRSRRPRVRVTGEIPVVAPRPLSADVLRAMPVTPTGWPEREAPRPVADEGPIVRLAPASEPRPTATASASSALPGPVTLVPGAEPTSQTIPSARGSARAFGEELGTFGAAPLPQIRVESAPPVSALGAPVEPEPMRPSTPRTSVASILPAEPASIAARVVTPSIAYAPPPPVSIAPVASRAEVGVTLAPAANDAARAPARSVLPGQPKDSLAPKASAAPPKSGGRWARALVSLAVAVAAGAAGFVWTARHAAREAGRESAAQVDAVRGSVAENHDRVVGLEGRAASWDRAGEKLAGLTTASLQHEEDIDTLRAKIARLEGDVTGAHDRQRRLQAQLELAAIREQTAWAFPKARPPAPEPVLATPKSSQPNATEMPKRVHAAKATNPFAPTRPLP